MKQVSFYQEPFVFSMASLALERRFDKDSTQILWSYEDLSPQVPNTRVLGVVLYENYTGEDIEISAVGFETGWLTRSLLFSLFAYPFGQLDCRRVTSRVLSSNRAARRLCEHMGFRQEGLLRKALHGEDIVVYGMLREECRFIGSRNGKKEQAEGAGVAGSNADHQDAVGLQPLWDQHPVWVH